MRKRKKSVPLQPLSRGRAAEDDRLSEAGATEESVDAAPSILPCGCARERERISRTPSENLLKIFSKKTLKKFGGYEKTPYLCKRFPAETGARKKR